jgi:hypothetical protein
VRFSERFNRRFRFARALPDEEIMLLSNVMSEFVPRRTLALDDRPPREIFATIRKC